MREFHEKRRLRRIVYSRLSLVILVVFIGIALKGAWGMYQKYHETVLNRRDAERHVADVSTREEFLQSEIERLKSGGGLDQEIREKFNVKKEGEEVVVIVDDKNSETEMSRASVASLWLWFKNLFRRD